MLAPLANQTARRRARIASACRTVCESLESRTLMCGAAIDYHPPVIDPAEVAAAAERSARSRSAERGGPDGGPDGAQIDIIWVNENITTGNNDNRFDDVFGANADAAKAVVNAVIDAWERVIVSFNYANGAPDVYSLYVSMEEHGERLGGFGSASHYNNGKPDIGAAVLGRGRDANGDDDGDGVGWYLDPTPTEHSEFLGRQTNAFAGKAHPNSNPAFGLDDF